ncbi:MAG: response regulator transcription factor [Limnochordia bacterium]|nr:response regulator transcription factor [Limnochordia bacterium]MDD2630632.1 response regulator transcription factor [Limnochordia bacterium]MDD4518565.1 response regulator transcription factor [Limnochordia bacterium]
MERILVIEDNWAVSEVIRLYLAKASFEVECVADGQRALERLKEHWDLVILDLMLPGVSGEEICQGIRKESDLPVIMLTAKSTCEDRIAGLVMGADDYIVKPFNPEELVARVHSVLRRSAPKREQREEIIKVPGLILNYTQRRVSAGAQVIDMTPKEFELLWYLAANRNLILTREQIFKRIWPYDDPPNTLRRVDVHINGIRDKLQQAVPGSSYIKTVRGIGYRFEVRS